MPDREVITLSDPCVLAGRWGVDLEVMRKVFLAAELFTNFTRHPVQIISGYRTQMEQQLLRRSGRPAAPDDLSTHRSCPATGVDISLAGFATRDHKLFWGQMVESVGLRWGGGSELSDGIPSDWRHVDDGPRKVRTS